MGDNKNPDRHTERNRGHHGNSTTGIAKTERRLQRGQDFTGLALEFYHNALAQYGYSEADLVGMGTSGAIVDKTAKLHAVADLLWAALMGAAACGHVIDFIALEKRYGNRLTQSLNFDYKLRELQMEHDSILDYEDVLADEKT